MTDIALDGPHWSFTLRLYGLPGVSEACLVLQDRLGVDVDFLLLAAYAAAERGIALEAHDVEAMDGVIAPWRNEVVAELRKMRRRLKLGPVPAPSVATEGLRTRIKGAELDAERIEQAALVGWLEAHVFARPRTHVDIGRTLRMVVDHFANTSGASAGTVAADDVQGAMRTLIEAATRLGVAGVEGIRT